MKHCHLLGTRNKFWWIWWEQDCHFRTKNVFFDMFMDKKLSSKAVGLKIVWQNFDESISKYFSRETLCIMPKLGRTLKIETIHAWEIFLTKQGSQTSSLYGSMMIIGKNSNYIELMTSIINCVKKPKKGSLMINKILDHLTTHVAGSLNMSIGAVW